MQSQSQLFESIFKTRATGADATALLKDITQQFPYFTPAHFFLLQHTGTVNEQQAAQTALLFNNPHWLSYRLLHPVDAPTPIAAAAQENIMTAAVPTAPEHEPQAEEPAPAPPIAKQRDAGITAAALDVAPAEMNLFEPMHMVDYFASQGIKLSDDQQAGDKLGKQLKSFTEWLRTMKKVHADKLPAGSPQADIAVQTLAEKSNAEDEVVTESMAEVFAMQGKTAKAMEVYKKLSLLNPGKSAFFAAKIEQLKG